jgi:hypothetical protein
VIGVLILEIREKFSVFPNITDRVFSPLIGEIFPLGK